MIVQYILNLITLVFSSFYLKKYLHIYQLKNYNNNRYISYFHICFYIFIFISLLLSVIFILKNVYLNIFCYFIILFISICLNFNLIKSKKTPIVWTPFLKRIYCLCLYFSILLLSFPYSSLIQIFLCPFLPIFANAINIYDKIKNQKLVKNAKRKLQDANIKIIAITGSNGKTSVKNILQEILSKRFIVKSTPASYNTPLGIAKFVNSEDLSKCNFLILEYGARRKNDIKKLCNLFGADYGIITNVNPQHLETFRTKDNIYQTKKELSMFLKNSLCIYNLDNAYTRLMFEEKVGKRIGVSVKKSSNISASNIRIQNFKTKFDLKIGGKTYRISTSLLGEHNVTNIILATALSKFLKIKDNDIVSAIENLKPTPHRLEYINADINILDDTYNCSIESAKQAIKVFDFFPNKKMIVTPGIIEAGSETYNINFELGKLCSNSSLCVIVGKENKEAILDGLKSQGFNEQNIMFAKNLEQAKCYFFKLNLNDSLLLLNDLPDDYK